MTTILHGTTTRRWLSSFIVPAVSSTRVLPLSCSWRGRHRLCADAESPARVVITMDSTPLGEAVVTLMGTDFFARTGADGGSRLRYYIPVCC